MLSCVLLDDVSLLNINFRIENGRITIYVSEMFCKVVVKNAILKDSGAWDVALVRMDNHAEKKHYNHIVKVVGKSIRGIYENVYGLIFFLLTYMRISILYCELKFN